MLDLSLIVVMKDGRIFGFAYEDTAEYIKFYESMRDEIDTTWTAKVLAKILPGTPDVRGPNADFPSPGIHGG